MKKVWLISMVVVLMFVSMACSSGNEGASKAGNSKGNNGGDDPVTIKFHALGATFPAEEMKPVIAEFEKRNPEIKVDYVPLAEGSPAESMKKIDLLSASGEDLDVVSLVAGHYEQRASIGLLEPLNPFIKAEGIDYNEEYRADVSIDGTYYALPGAANQWLVIINKKHLDEAGLPVPFDWTWEDFIEYAKAMTKGEGADKRYGAHYHKWPGFYTLALFGQPEHNTIVEEDGTINLDDPAVRQSMEIRYQTEVTDQSATPLAEVISQKLGYRPVFFNEKASMLPMGSWIIGDAGGSEKFPVDFETVFAPIPKNSEDDEIGNSLYETQFLSIISTSKHKEESYKFMRFLSTEGIGMTGNQLSSWKKENTLEVVDKMIGESLRPELVDKESLSKVIQVTKAVSPTSQAPYHAETFKEYKEEFDLMLLGEQDIDTTLENMKKRVEKVVEANK